MEKFNSKNLTNIKSIVHDKTNVTFASPARKYSMKQCAIIAACMLCFISLSAFAYYKFNSLNGDELALSSVYLGEGKFEVIITNMSEHNLKLQDNVKVMQWSTGKEIDGNRELIQVESCEIPAQKTESMIIDISKAYDIEYLQKNINSDDWYYFVVTNNNYAFGQDWMCSFSFDHVNEDEIINAHNALIEYANENTPYIPSYENGVLIFDEWAQPVKDMKISCLFGKQNNGAFSDHINIAGIEGDEIFAVSDGAVVDAGFDATYGNYVVLALNDNINVTYGHLKSMNVSKGDTVAKNDVIGLMGKTGRATGPNLLFAVSVEGENINPLK